jgi:hypothetical protein
LRPPFGFLPSFRVHAALTYPTAATV